MSKTGKISAAIWMLVVIGMLALLVLGYGVYQMTAVPPVQPAEPTPGETTTSLWGKSVVLSTAALDKAADDVNTKAAVPVYVLTGKNGFVYTDEDLSSSARTDLTNGLTVGDTATLWAFNNTWYSKGPVDKYLATQQETVDLEVYAVTDDLDMTLYNSDGTALTEGSNANISIAAGATDYFEKFKIKQNVSNRAFNFLGIFADLDTETNISAITIGAMDTTLAETTTGLKRVTTDDYIWQVSTPVMLLEYDSIVVGPITITGDGDGCSAGTSTTADDVTLYVFDGNYYFSTKGAEVKFGGETDAVSPADVGASDQSYTFICI